MAPIKCRAEVLCCCLFIYRQNSSPFIPKGDKLRALWMSYVVTVKSELLSLSKGQLVNKHVNEKHFDRYQLDDRETGSNMVGLVIHVYLFTSEGRGRPWGAFIWSSYHNYNEQEKIEEISENPVVAQHRRNY